jgi:CrcB protein
VAYLLVAIGGAAGAAARYGIALWVNTRWGWSFPWGTLAVNLTGSFIIGALMPVLVARGPDHTLRLLLVTGVLGGYTTFSAFSFETVTLLHASQWQSAALYVAGSVIFSLLACGLGFALGQGIIR